MGLWPLQFFLILSGAGTDFRRQNLTSVDVRFCIDVRFLRLKTVRALKGLTSYRKWIGSERACLYSLMFYYKKNYLEIMRVGFWSPLSTAGSIFSDKLRYIAGFWLKPTIQKPTIHRTRIWPLDCPLWRWPTIETAMAKTGFLCLATYVTDHYICYFYFTFKMYCGEMKYNVLHDLRPK